MITYAAVEGQRQRHVHIASAAGAVLGMVAHGTALVHHSDGIEANQT